MPHSLSAFLSRLRRPRLSAARLSDSGLWVSLWLGLRRWLRALALSPAHWLDLGRRSLCLLMATVLTLNPLYQTMVFTRALAVVLSPLAALVPLSLWPHGVRAQTPPPTPPPTTPPAPPPLTPPPGAVDGQTFGQTLLHGPTTDGGKIYYPGQNGTESIDSSALFPASGSQDDTQKMMDAFGDSNAAQIIDAAVAQRLNGENSQQADAIQTVRNSALNHSHPDMSNDPVMTHSQSILDGTDPVFQSFFSGCTQTTVPNGGGQSIHVPDPQYCDRVIVPATDCQITHDYDTGLVNMIGGEGGIQSCGEGCLDLFVGKVGDNYWTGNCTIFEQTVRVQVVNGAAITSAVLSEAKWDDYIQILLGGQKLWQGPNTDFPPETAGPCDLKTNWDQTMSVDLTPQFQQNGTKEFLIRVSVGGNGEGYARIRLMYDPHKIATVDKWTVPEDCSALISGIADGACTLTSMSCLNGPSMDTQCIDVNGFQLCQADLSPLPAPLPGYSPLCRQGDIKGTCNFMSGPMQCFTDPNGVQHCPTNNGDNPDGCLPFENNTACAFVSSSCLPFAVGKSGACYAYQEKWDCGQDVSVPGGTTTQTQCDGPIRCMGQECSNPPNDSNPDFAKAAGALSALTFMAMDMHCTVDNDPDTCRIFGGDAMECKKALGGYQNCCDQPVSIGLADYLQFAKANYDLAKKLQLAQKLADEGLNIPGAWQAVKTYSVNTLNAFDDITGNFFSNAYESLSQSYAGEALQNLSLSALKQEMMNAVGSFVQNVFGDTVYNVFFQTTTDEATGESVTALSDGFATALSVVMWVYTVYVIVNMLISIIWACEQSEFMLAARRQMKDCNFIGTYCKSNTPFGCIETRDAYCCYDSPLARIVMEGASTQLNLTFGTPQTPDCEGLTIAQMASLDWDKIDLQQWFAILAANGQIPNGAASFQSTYSLQNITHDQYTTGPSLNAPQRVQNEVDGAQYFDEASQAERDQLWNQAH